MYSVSIHYYIQIVYYIHYYKDDRYGVKIFGMRNMLETFVFTSES